MRFSTFEEDFFAEAAPASSGSSTSGPRPLSTSGASGTPQSSSGTAPSGSAADRYAAYVQAGSDLVRLGSQLARQFRSSRRSPSRPPGRTAAPPRTGPAPAAPGYAAPAPGDQPPPSLDQLAALLYALQQRQVPPLPGTAPVVGEPVPAMPGAPGGSQTQALELLRVIIANPQFQQALQQAAAGGPAAPRTVTLPVPSAPTPSAPLQPVDIPLGAVMNTVASLAGQSMTDLNAMTTESDPQVPSYLVSEEGDFIVDPASPDDRAALVAHLFCVSDQAQRLQNEWQTEDQPDESEMWLLEAGVTR